MTAELTLQDWETLYNMIKQKDDQISCLEGRLERLENRIPDTSLLNKNLLIRVLTVMCYTLIWIVAIQWWYVAAAIAIIVIGVMLFRKWFYGNSLLDEDEHYGMNPLTRWPS